MPTRKDIFSEKLENDFLYLADLIADKIERCPDFRNAMCPEKLHNLVSSVAPLYDLNDPHYLPYHGTLLNAIATRLSSVLSHKEFFRLGLCEHYIRRFAIGGESNG